MSPAFGPEEPPVFCCVVEGFAVGVAAAVALVATGAFVAAEAAVAVALIDARGVPWAMAVATAAAEAVAAGATAAAVAVAPSGDTVGGVTPGAGVPMGVFVGGLVGTEPGAPTITVPPRHEPMSTLQRTISCICQSAAADMEIVSWSVPCDAAVK
jgi:hypothetical protein